MGLVCISVSYDDEEDGAKFALPFLKKQNATFQNFRLDEDNEVKANKFGVDVLPTVIVYGKDGQQAKKFTTVEPFTYKDVEQFIRPLLK
jgi:thioredoxin-like negative regulator of GroEL